MLHQIIYTVSSPSESRQESLVPLQNQQHMPIASPHDHVSQSSSSSHGVAMLPDTQLSQETQDILAQLLSAEGK